MNLWKTDKTDLTTEEVEGYIERHMAEALPRLNRLAAYAYGKNPTILLRKPSDPDNRTPAPFGRKIVNTFTGYAYRPGYITYKAGERADESYMAAISDVFKANHEPLKTERGGRNTAVFGVAYELHYYDEGVTPRFMAVDPRSVILLYDMEPEPKKIIGVRYERMTDTLYKVEVYTRTTVRKYDRISRGGGKWEYEETESRLNLYRAVPITPYYMGDDCLGLIEPVAPLIDDYDTLISDSMIEFSRFANAYLRIVGAAAPDPTGQNPMVLRQWLANLKNARVFDRLKAAEDVTFLTKDIPKEFIDFMSKLLKDEIYAQSHVPDFGSDKFSGALSGAAIERMLFDFENVVSSAEADFNLGLYDRIGLITTVLKDTTGIDGSPEDIVISHRRNIPVDEKDAAEVAVAMRNAGISMKTTLESMPRDMVPNVDEELKRQGEEGADAVPDLDQAPPEKPEESDQGDEAV